MLSITKSGQREGKVGKRRKINKSDEFGMTSDEYKILIITRL
jgi:hypothetical protein